MIWALLGAHAVVCLMLPALASRLGRAVFVVGALPPAATTLWALTRLGSTDDATAQVTWVAGLDLTMRFRIDDIALLMTLLVSGIGALVFVYASGYFSVGAAGLGRFSATLLAFSAAMAGLVWADSVWALFVFWELTSVTSFLLVGHKATDPVARTAARRALVLTVAGGIVLMGGLVVFLDEAGSASLSGLGPMSGPGASVAAATVLVAAATKSAQVPFHVWLPGAMAAPTPVSAYLHSATMVKAGVLLVALFAPAFTEVALWKPLGLAFGLASMLWGAIGALRHVDAKLILAWGTISQLGLMIALLSLGTAKATFAAMSLLAAHAVFKAALFMVVGEVDVRTGTRDIAELSGLWRSMPLAFAVALISGASMAGVPPLLGFPAKEAAIEAVLGLGGNERLMVGSLVIGGSVLTVAYTTRFLWGVFGPGPNPTTVSPRRATMAAPSALLAVGSVAGFGALGSVTSLVRSAAVEIDEKAEVYALVRWPGLTDAFVTSLAVVAGGLAFGAVLASRSGGATPRPVGATLVDDIIDGALWVARRVTAQVQHGSLPVYLATMAAVAALAATPFGADIDLDALYRWDSPVQAVLGLVVVAAAGIAAAVGSRLGAALGLGAVGIGVSGLFVVQGAPDLAMTQLLVETVVVVGFVVALGHLARNFPSSGHVWRGFRLAVAGLAGLAVAAGLAASASGPTGRPPLDELTRQAVDEGGGNNVVNVILTDIRALDTLGEVVVLLVVAAGVLALCQAGRVGGRA